MKTAKKTGLSTFTAKCIRETDLFDGCGESDSLWEHVQVNYPDLNDDKAYHWIDAAELLEWLENALTEDVIPGSESDDWPAVLDTVRHRIEKAKIDLVYFGD